MKTRTVSVLAILSSCLVALACAPTLAIAQSDIPPVQNADASVRFTHLTTEDGLSQSKVTAILQDSRGFMWIGTQSGLNRYDGYEFTIYQHDPHNSNRVSSQ